MFLIFLALAHLRTISNFKFLSYEWYWNRNIISSTYRVHKHKNNFLKKHDTTIANSIRDYAHAGGDTVVILVAEMLYCCTLFYWQFNDEQFFFFFFFSAMVYM